MTRKYTKDGYIRGAGPKMAAILKKYVRTEIVKESGVSWFFVTNYGESKPIPPSMKKDMINYMKKQIVLLKEAIEQEESHLKD